MEETKAADLQVMVVVLAMEERVEAMVATQVGVAMVVEEKVLSR